MKKLFLAIMLFFILNNAMAFDPPVLLTPTDSSVIPLMGQVFIWTPDMLAITYQIQISENTSFTAMVVNILLPSAQYTVTTPVFQNSHVYYWRVRTTRAIGQSNWSSVRQFTAQNSIGIKGLSSEIPGKNKLFENYPNPFNPVTNIEYQITNKNVTSLVIYDALGKILKTLVNEMQMPGVYEVNFDGSNFSSGIYFYRLQSGDFTDTKRMVLVK
ncbi:MAG: T9SS type A sorting domain-containing protein [Ignavibacteriae bacterium]|nr:T9SS type A sorting domain-containing protein [Ignavibacteriota bacterium]